MNTTISDNIDHFDKNLDLAVNNEGYSLYFNSHKQKISAKGKLLTVKNNLFSKHKSELLDNKNYFHVMNVISLYRNIIKIQFADNNVYSGTLLVKLSKINMNLCKWAHLKYYYNLTVSLIQKKNSTPGREINEILDGFETQLKLKSSRIGKDSPAYFYLLADMLSNLALSVFYKERVHEEDGFPYSNTVLANEIHYDITELCSYPHLILTDYQKLKAYQNKRIVEIDKDPNSIGNRHAQSEFLKEAREEEMKERSYPYTHTNKYQKIEFKLENGRDYLQQFLKKQEELLCSHQENLMIEKEINAFLLRSDHLPAEIIGMIQEYVDNLDFSYLVRDYMQSMPALQPTRARAS